MGSEFLSQAGKCPADGLHDNVSVLNTSELYTSK